MFGLYASDSVVSLAVHRGQYLNDPTGPTVQGRKCQLQLGPKQHCLTDFELVICHCADLDGANHATTAHDDIAPTLMRGGCSLRGYHGTVGS